MIAVLNAIVMHTTEMYANVLYSNQQCEIWIKQKEFDCHKNITSLLDFTFPNFFYGFQAILTILSMREHQKHRNFWLDIFDLKEKYFTTQDYKANRLWIKRKNFLMEVEKINSTIKLK